jgi:hypothetical protein
LADNDLLVMVPTRGRRAQCERLLESFAETATCSDLLFIADPDDEDTYEGMDWGPAVQAVLDPREYTTGKLNKTGLAMAGLYDVLAWVGNDHVFRTPGWDKLMLATLKGMGRCGKCGPDGTAPDECPGHGWVYPDDKRRSDVPEIWMCSSDVVRTLGWFACPAVQHYYCDNAAAELGKRSGLIRWCPEAVIEHLHYSVAPGTEHDELYKFAEDKFGQADLVAFKQWQADRLPVEVAMLRREYSPDVSWAISLI